MNKEMQDKFRNILTQLPSTFKQDDIFVNVLNNIIQQKDISA
jgi:hypothetical protein